MLLGPNSKLRVDAALQPWQGAFDPTVNLGAGEDPSDNAFLADGSTLTGRNDQGMPATFYELNLTLRNRYDLRLMPAPVKLKDVPNDKEKHLVIIADVTGPLLIRVFDRAGDPPTDLDTSKNGDLVAELKKRLENLWHIDPIPARSKRLSSPT